MCAKSKEAKIRVALIFGGKSSEHTISCATAAAVLQAIDRDRYDVIPIGISPRGHWVLMADDAAPLMLGGSTLPQVPESPASVSVPWAVGERALRVVEPGKIPVEVGDVDVVFPLLHGPFGEDGTLQGLLELAELPYVGCGVAASAVMMDKAFMKIIFASAGLPQVPYEVITGSQWREDRDAALARASALRFPLFVKPARAGSSMGVSKVRRAEDLAAAIEEAQSHDPKVIVEEGVIGREVECGVLGGGGVELRVSPVGEVAVVDHEFYDYDAKYFDEDSTQIIVPADLPDDVSERLRSLAKVAFEAADCEGLARVDFFYTEDGELFLNEINTMPGFTPFSMYPRVWQAAGIGYTQLIDELIEQALHRPQGLR